MASGSEGHSASADQDEATAQEEAGTGAGQEEEHTASAEQSPDSGDGERGGGESQGAGQERGASEEDDARQDDEDDEGGDGPSRGSVAAAIDDVSSLPGETVNDQDGRKIGEVKEIYAVGEDETPMWVTIESATGLGRSRHVFVPLARIKRQKDEIRVPYSYGHIHESPEVEPGDELSEEDDRALRVYYAIGLADQELVADAQSYASQVPDEDGPAHKVEASSAEGPVREIDDAPPAERAAEAYEKQKEEEGEDHRKSTGATADEIFDEDGAGDGEDKGGGEDKADGSEAKEQPKSEQEEGGAADKDGGGEGESGEG